jgi:hypothetical protein
MKTERVRRWAQDVLEEQLTSEQVTIIYKLLDPVLGLRRKLP